MPARRDSGCPVLVWACVVGFVLTQSLFLSVCLAGRLFLPLLPALLFGPHLYLCLSLSACLVLSVSPSHPLYLPSSLAASPSLSSSFLAPSLVLILLDTSGIVHIPHHQTPAISKSFALDGVVTLVDAKNILPRLREGEKGAAGGPAEGGEEEIDEAFQQIMFSDRIVVNKVRLCRGICEHHL